VQEVTARDRGPDMQRTLVDAVCRLSFMTAQRDRQSFVRELAAACGDLPEIPDNSSTRIHVIEIVRACLSHPRGLHCLVSTLELFAPEQRVTIEVVELIRSFDVLETMPRDDRRQILNLLSQVEHLDIRALWYAATDGTASVLSVPVRTLGAAFDHLAGLNARADGVPPTLALVEYVAAHLMGSPAPELRQWNEVQAERLGLTSELAALRVQAEATSLAPSVPPCLVVQFAEYGIDSRRYVMSHWIQHRPGPWQPDRGEDQIVTLESAESAVEGLISHAETIWSKRSGRVVVEFVLPTPLLNEAVDWWLTGARSSGGVPLCLDYPVVVRSLERMRTLNYHRFWRNRWEAMAAAPSLRAHWMLSSDDISVWNAQLHSDESLSVVVLNEPPASAPGTKATQLWMALLAGIPVVLWDRRERRADNFEGVVDELVDGAPSGLIDRIQKLRKEAAVSVDADNTKHLGRHLAVLWDDPDRLVDVWPYAPLNPDSHERKSGHE